MARVDYAARARAEVFRPLLDAQLARLARAAGADAEALLRELRTVPARGSQWDYLLAALPVVRASVAGERTRRALGRDWFGYFLDGRHELYVGHSLGDGSYDDEAWGDEAGGAIDVQYYPREAAAALAQHAFVGGYDADVVGLYLRDGYQSVFHAHPEGFWILGHDVVDFVRRAADKLEGRPPSDEELEVAAPAPVPASAPVAVEQPARDSGLRWGLESEHPREAGIALRVAEHGAGDWDSPGSSPEESGVANSSPEVAATPATAAATSKPGGAVRSAKQAATSGGGKKRGAKRGSAKKGSAKGASAKGASARGASAKGASAKGASAKKGSAKGASAKAASAKSGARRSTRASGGTRRG